MLFISIVYPLVTRFFFFSFVIRGSLRLSFIWSSQFSLCVRYSPVNKRFKRYRPKYNPAGYRFKGEKEIGDTNTKTPTAGHSLLEQTITRWKKASSSSANRTSKEKAITLLCIGLNLILGKES